MLEVIKWVICLVLVALAWPIGIFLAKTTEEELEGGKKLFKTAIVLVFISAVIDFVFVKNFGLQVSILATLAFVGIVLYESVIYKKPN